MSNTRGRDLPQPLHVLNEGAAFLIELLMLAGLAWWGAQAVNALALRITLAIGTPALAMVIWGLLAAPRARIQLPMTGVLAVKAIVFGGATVGVYSIGHHGLAIGFAVAAILNMTVAALDRDARARTHAGSGGSRQT
jgi:hypothetical protein